MVLLLSSYPPLLLRVLQFKLLECVTPFAPCPLQTLQYYYGAIRHRRGLRYVSALFVTFGISLCIPTAAACRGFDACACTPTPRDRLSFHWQLRLHLIWKVANPFIYRCAPRGTRTGTLTLFSGSMYFPSDPQPWQLQLLRRIALIPIDFSNYFILIC